MHRCPDAPPGWRAWRTAPHPHGPARPVRITPGWLERRGFAIDRNEGSPVCEGKMPGFISRQAIYAKGRRMAAQQDCHCRQPAPLTSTQYAQRVLAVVGGVVLLAMAGVIIHVAIVAALGLAAMALLAGAWWTVRRVRGLRQPVLIPAPLPGAPARTTVTGVRVRALGPSRAAASTALPSAGMTATPSRAVPGSRAASRPRDARR